MEDIGQHLGAAGRDAAVGVGLDEESGIGWRCFRHVSAVDGVVAAECHDFARIVVYAPADEDVRDVACEKPRKDEDPECDVAGGLISSVFEHLGGRENDIADIHNAENDVADTGLVVPVGEDH